MAQTTGQLYTIGYSGHTVETFIQTLQARNISILIDIRMTPISRKKGFSKTALYQALRAADITYYHLRALGSPVELRRNLYVDGNYEEFFTAFRTYLNLQKNSLQYVASLVATQPICLMCVEKHPQECHRSVVADAIAQVLGEQITIEHLPALIPAAKVHQKALAVSDALQAPI